MKLKKQNNQNNNIIMETNINDKLVSWDDHLDKKYGKAATTKNYISGIENNASDIRLSTLMRIIRKGLGGHLKLTLDL